MKLYLTLEDGKDKVERVIEINVSKEACEFDGVQEICDSMLETIYSTKDEELRIEANRLTQHND